MATLNEQITKAFRKAECEHRRLVQRVAALGYVFDEGEAEELTTNDLAAKVLKKLGLETPRDGNCVEALNAWLAGHEHASDRIRGVRSSMDAAEMPDWFHRYIA